MIYIASPYAHPNAKVREERYHAVTNFLVNYINEGKVCYSPIAHCIGFSKQGAPLSTQHWDKINKEFLTKSDSLTVLCINGWDEDFFVRSCVRYARDHDMPVLFKDIDGNDIYRSTKTYKYSYRKRRRAR